MASVYEIHRYHHDDFQYAVARTSKYSDERVRKDVDKMNSLLSNEMRAQGIRYVFATGSMSDMTKQRTKKSKKEERQPSIF